MPAARTGRTGTVHRRGGAGRANPDLLRKRVLLAG